MATSDTRISCKSTRPRSRSASWRVRRPTSLRKLSPSSPSLWRSGSTIWSVQPMRASGGLCGSVSCCAVTYFMVLFCSSSRSPCCSQLRHYFFFVAGDSFVDNTVFHWSWYLLRLGSFQPVTWSLFAAPESWQKKMHFQNMKDSMIKWFRNFSNVLWGLLCA